MEEEVVARFSKFKLIERESERVFLATDDILQRKEECDRSVLGKVWGSKSANFQGLKTTMNQLWCHKRDLKVLELGYNFYQFVFSDPGEKERVLQKKPWFFDNQIVVLHSWTAQLKQGDPIFARSQAWVQIRGLPNHWSSTAVGWKIGKVFPVCLNVVASETGSRDGLLLRILVEIELDKPLFRGVQLQLGHEMVWVEFKYEQLPTFCHYCGVVGHQEKSCERKMSDSRANSICEGQYGEWMRASLPRGVRKVGIRETFQKKDERVMKELVVHKDSRLDAEEEQQSEKHLSQVLDSAKGEKSKESDPMLGHRDPIVISRQEEQIDKVDMSPKKILSFTKGTSEEEFLSPKDQPSEGVTTEGKTIFLGRVDSMHIDPVTPDTAGRVSVLQEIGQDVLQQQAVAKDETKIAGTGTWKRKARARKGMELSNIENEQTSHGCPGTKRLLEQDIEILKEKAEERMEKKQKCPGKENDWSCIKVKVASLEWPHLHK